MDFSEELKKVFLAGVGAVSMTAETAGMLTYQLIKMAELSAEMAKPINEELKQAVTPKKEETTVDSVMSAADQLTPEQKQELIDKLTADK